MGRTRVFTSFDFDNDQDLRTLLIGQAKNPDSPFEMVDFSLKTALTGDWKDKIQTRIKSVDQVIVLCGEYTDTATGVSAELQIARGEKKPYFLLKGRANRQCKRPSAAVPSDKMYDWTWPNLKLLIGGAR
jgi:hypothetical protein